MLIRNHNIEVIKDKNDIVRIELNCSGTSGFIWQSKYDSKYLDLLKKNFIPLSKNFGASSVEVFEYKAKRKGQTKVIFHYKRPWMRKSEKTVEYYIKVI